MQFGGIAEAAESIVGAGLVVGAVVLIGKTIARRTGVVDLTAPSSWTSVGALVFLSVVSVAIGIGARVLFHADIVVPGIVAGATVAYAGFTIRLVAAGERQVKALESQLSDERIDRAAATKRAAEEAASSKHAFRAAAQAHLDATVPTATVEVVQSKTELIEPGPQIGTLDSRTIGEIATNPADRHVKLHLDLRVRNFGPQPALLTCPPPRWGGFTLPWLTPVLLLGPDVTSTVHWSVDIDGRQLQHWAATGSLPTDELLSIELVLETITRAVRDVHRWRGTVAPLSPAVLPPPAVTGPAVAELTRSYPGLEMAPDDAPA